jgi:hypothetical protein
MYPVRSILFTLFATFCFCLYARAYLLRLSLRFHSYNYSRILLSQGIIYGKFGRFSRTDLATSYYHELLTFSSILPFSDIIFLFHFWLTFHCQHQAATAVKQIFINSNIIYMLDFWILPSL